MPDVADAAALLRLPRRVAFGRGSIHAIADEAAALGTRALVVTDANVAATPAFGRAMASLADAGIEARIFDSTPPDIPPDAVAACLDVARGDGREAVEVVIGFGGGSSLDLAKVASLLVTHGGPLSRYYGELAIPGPVLPVIAVPTTAGTGSEVTPVAVVSDPTRRLKVGISDPQIVPRIALCDPDLTITCPPAVTAHAGIDALVHAVEALLAPGRARRWDVADAEVFRGSNPLIDPYALAALERISGSLERAVADGDDIEARASMQYGALCAGIAFGHAGTAGAHALQYPLGAATGTPHGLGVGLLAPYVLAYVSSAAEGALARVAGALGVARSGDSPAAAASRAVAEVTRLASAVGIPRTLRDLGVQRDALPGFADDAATITRLLKNSPRPLARDDLLEILEAAWSGDGR